MEMQERLYEVLRQAKDQRSLPLIVEVADPQRPLSEEKQDESSKTDQNLETGQQPKKKEKKKIKILRIIPEDKNESIHGSMEVQEPTRAGTSDLPKMQDLCQMYKKLNKKLHQGNRFH